LQWGLISERCIDGNAWQVWLHRVLRCEALLATLDAADQVRPAWSATGSLRMRLGERRSKRQYRQ